MAKVGRPKIFKSVEEVEEKINAYFKYCEDKDKPYTMSGLAYYLDVDRRTIVNYTKEEEFFPAIKKARDRVQMQLEENALLNKGNPTFTIFNLKNNFDWKDKIETNTENFEQINESLHNIANLINNPVEDRTEDSINEIQDKQ